MYRFGRRRATARTLPFQNVDSGKKDIRYDMSSTPQAADFDEPTYRQALHDADAEQIDLRGTVSRLHLVEIEDDVIAWARGAIPTLPADARARTTAQFDLSSGASARPRPS